MQDQTPEQATVVEFGDLKVNVDRGGVADVGIIVTLRPKTQEEFERAVEITGGWEGLRMPRFDQGYETHAARGDGDVVLMIHEPPRTERVEGRTDHPFFTRYRDRVETPA